MSEINQEMQQEINALKERLLILEKWTEALFQGTVQYLETIKGQGAHVIAGKIRDVASKISKEPNADI